MRRARTSAGVPHRNVILPTKAAATAARRKFLSSIRRQGASPSAAADADHRDLRPGTQVQAAVVPSQRV